MQKVFFLLVFLIGLSSYSAEAQLLRSKSEKKLNVSPTWYVTDVNGFQLIFADREGRIENLEDLKTHDRNYDPDVVIIKDEKFGDYRIAETIEEAMQADTLNASSNLTAFRRKHSQIIEYKRTGRN